MNVELEILYSAKEKREQVIGCGDPIEAALRDQGHAYGAALLAEGNTGERFDNAFSVLTAVGLYSGALRHELTNPAREARSPFPEASSLLCMWEQLSRWRRDFRPGIWRRTISFGISRPVADDLFDVAQQAHPDVMRFNDRLMTQLDVDWSFYSVRPYYKPYCVGPQGYRGANAGDFSRIDDIDLLLGLCRATDPYDGQLLVDKMLFMLPSDRAELYDSRKLPG